MGNLLLSLLESIAPTLISWGLGILEKSNPGIGSVIKSIIDYIRNHPVPAEASSNVSIGLKPLIASSPETKGLS